MIKKKIKISTLFFYAVILLLFVLILLFPSLASRGALSGLVMCGKIIIPTLFPLFVVSSMFVTSGFAQAVGKIAEKPLRAVFGIPGACATVLILGLVAGFPVGAKSAALLYENGLCSKNDAERLILCCNNPGLAFVVGTVGAGMWKKASVGWILWGVQTAVSLCICFFVFRKGKSKIKKNTAVSLPVTERQPFALTFTSAVTDSAGTVISICAYIVLFSSFAHILSDSGAAAYAAQVLSFIFPGCGEAVILGTVEMTNGISLIPENISAQTALAVTSLILGWSGFCVHMQIISAAARQKLKCKYLPLTKLIQGIISAAVMYFISFFICAETPSFSDKSFFNYNGIFFAALLLLFAVTAVVITFVKYVKKSL